MSYQGSLRLKGESMVVHKRHFGVLRIEDDKIVFLFDSGNITKIMFEEIDSIVIYKKRFGRPLITLKDRKEFIFCIKPSSNWATFGSLGGQIDQRNQIRRGNQEVFNTLNYLIKTFKESELK